MIFLKDVNELQQLLHSKRLYSPDVISIHIPELNSHEVIATESRINLLKKVTLRWLPAKVMLVIFAVIIGIMINSPGLYPYFRMEFLPVILGICILCGIVSLFLGKLIIKIKLHYEIRLLLKQIHRLESNYEQNWVFD